MGIGTENIHRKPVYVYEDYEYKEDKGMKERIFKGYRLQQNLYIISDEVTEIEELAFNPITLLDQEIIIRNSNLEYYSSRIDELKKKLLQMLRQTQKTGPGKCLKILMLSWANCSQSVQVFFR